MNIQSQTVRQLEAIKYNVNLVRHFSVGRDLEGENVAL